MLTCFLYITKTICLATPYLNVKDKELEQRLQDRAISLKLFTLFNQKWSKKENIFNGGLLVFLNSMSVEKKSQLYELVYAREVDQISLLELIKCILTKGFNVQIKLAELRKRRSKN